MCNERERLLDYVYDEGDPADRSRIEAHLLTCEACRQEVAGFRTVRQDLLAWAVPDTPSVWRPFAPPPALPSWRAVPTWTMAAAAGVVLMAGMAGGAAATRWFAPVPQVVEAVPVVAGVTAAELARLESELRAEMAQQLEARVDALTREFEVVAARVDAVQDQSVSTELAAVTRRLDDTEEYLRTQAIWAAQIEDRTMRTRNAIGGARTPALPNVMVPVNFGSGR